MRHYNIISWHYIYYVRDIIFSVYCA